MKMCSSKSSETANTEMYKLQGRVGMFTIRLMDVQRQFARRKLIYRHLVSSGHNKNKLRSCSSYRLKYEWERMTNYDVNESWISKKKSFIYLFINPVELQYDILQATIIQQRVNQARAIHNETWQTLHRSGTHYFCFFYYTH